MPELLQQVQISPPPNDEILDEVGKPRKIFRPTQDALHMEGEFFENRYQWRVSFLGSTLWRHEQDCLSVDFFSGRAPIYSWSGAG